MQLDACRIPTRSRRQAMDWSLPLVSQGIQSTIESPQGDAGWALVVNPSDYDAAMDTIRLYEHENRRWGWRRQTLEPGLLFDWASLAWVALLGLFFWLDTHRIDLRSLGLMDSAAVAAGQWWRLFTAIWLHADIAHFSGNAVFGFVLIGLAMGRYGPATGLLAAYLAGVGGNLITLAPGIGLHRSLGASGMVMGALGLLAAQSLSLWRTSPHGRRYVLTALFGGILLFVFLGVSPDSDVLAHLGGFLCGLALGSALNFLPDAFRSPAANFVAGLIFAALVIWPWWLALRHGQ